MEPQIVQQAFEMLARASSTSEVLTLNLTNLLILIALKVVIVGFGIFSFGGNQARSSEETSLKSSDLTGGMCFIMFTSGAEEKLSCIQRTACEDPKTANDYLTAAKMVHNMGKYINMDMTQTYIDVYNGVQEAAEHAVNGGDCARYNW